MNLDERLRRLEADREVTQGTVSALICICGALFQTHQDRQALGAALTAILGAQMKAADESGMSATSKEALRQLMGSFHQALTEPHPTQFQQTDEILRRMMRPDGSAPSAPKE